MHKIRAGIDPLIEKRAAIHEGKTLSQLVDAYLSSHDLKPRTINDYQYLLKKRLGQWGDRRVIDITKHEILDWYMEGRGRPVQTEQAFRFMSALMTFARGLEIISINPCHLVSQGSGDLLKRETAILR